MPSSSEQEIIAKAIAGDRRSFRRIVEQHQDFAYALAYRLTGNGNDAEDMVQEAFVKLWRNLAGYRTEIKVRTWLYTIVTNCCLDFLRSKQAKQRKAHSDLVVAEEISSSFSADTALHHQELMTTVLTIAETLTPKQRAVFVLRDLQHLDVSEISEILAMSPGNIKSNLYYARCAVAERIRLYYKESEKRII